MNEIRIQAANDYAWAESRMAVYRDDGATPPEPIRRLHTLSKMITDSPAPTAASGASEDTAKLQTELADVRAKLASAEKACAQSKADSVLALRDAAAVLKMTAGHLETGRPSAAPSAAVAVQRAPISLAHGLLLVQRTTRQHVIFSEPKQGQWFVQTMTSESLGPETATEPGKWWCDVWEEKGTHAHPMLAAHWSAAKPDAAPATPAGGQMAIPGSGPETAPPAKPKIADWQPNDDQINGYVLTLGESMAKAGASVAVTPDLVRSLIVKFKAEKGDAEVPKPGVSFYHWANKSLKG